MADAFNSNVDPLKKKPYTTGSIAANPMNLDGKTAEVKTAMGNNSFWDPQPVKTGGLTSFDRMMDAPAPADPNPRVSLPAGSYDYAPSETFASQKVDAANTAATAKPLPPQTSFAPTASAPMVSGATSTVTPATNLSLSSAAAAPVGQFAAPAAPAPPAVKPAGFQMPSAAELAAFRKSTGTNFDANSVNDKLNIERMRAQQNTFNSSQANAYRAKSGYKPGMYASR